MDGERYGFFGRGKLAGVCLVADRVIRAAREVASVPLSADLTLPDASDSPCVFVPVFMGVEVDTGSRNIGPGSEVLNGVCVIFSN